MERETRHIQTEYRLSTEGEQRKISGYAAVFNALSDDLGGFRELIKPGAFAKTLKESDVRALWNHDSNYPLGRVSAGTLRLWEDERGLGFELTLPNTSTGRDLAESMARGDVREMSFAFTAIRDQWRTVENEAPQRDLVEVRLYEVSPVVFPAYPQTSASVRAKVSELTDAPAQAGHPSDETAEQSAAQARVQRASRLLDLAERQ